MKLTHLSDLELIARFRDLLIEEREKLVEALESIIEMDRRKLIFHYSSLRACLVAEHGMEESQAERKIRSARMMRRFPELKSKLESGKLNLTLMELALGCAHREKLSDDELWELCEAISGMSTRAATREIACRYPESFGAPKDRIRPINEELSEVRFTAPQELLDKLDEIRGLLAHSHPHLTLAELIDILATEYRERHHPEAKARRAEERRKVGEAVESPTAPRATSLETEKRVPPRPVVHALTRQAGYVCSYVDPVSQKPCLSKHALQIDHRWAWSLGGKTELSNLRYLCRNHHARVSFLQFGESARYIRSKRE
jgi:5-methylcytosine-specific restriction endonuclease McrA